MQEFYKRIQQKALVSTVGFLLSMVAIVVMWRLSA